MKTEDKTPPGTLKLHNKSSGADEYEWTLEVGDVLLSYGALNYYSFVGAIGVHEGQLYVEIQTELDYSDIHVLVLDEEE